ncbi:MAG: hypothetical protein WC562_04065 [Dehalococcoidia bacterium]|jgi:uncharacterized membrane protein
MFGYFMFLSAIPGFFLSSFFLMLLWSVIAPDLGWSKIDYPMAMLITFTLWIAVSPLAAVAASRKKWWK